MANIKSSKKAIKTIAKRTENNHELKARVKNCIRNCDKAIEAGDKETAQKLLADVQRYMDRALSKGLVKRNTADRQKSRLASKVKEIFKELLKKPKFVFNKMYTVSKCNKQEVVTAFTGLLELSRRSKVTTRQEELFGDIIVEKNKRRVG